MKKKNKGLLGRLFDRKQAGRNDCPFICWKGMWYRQEWRDGGCEPVGEPLGPCPTAEAPPSAGSPPNAVTTESTELPLICWKGQLYRQKWVDGGLEAFGEPLGPC